MSTHSTIAIDNNDGTYTSIYCNWDGYPTGVGKELVTNYNSIPAANALMELGDLSSLCGGVEAHHRDFNEPWADVKFELYESFEELRNNAESYLYVYRNNDWYCYCLEVSGLVKDMLTSP